MSRLRFPATAVFAMVTDFWIMPVVVLGVDGLPGAHISGEAANALTDNGQLLLTPTGSLSGIVRGRLPATKAGISYLARALAAITIVALVPGGGARRHPYRGRRQPPELSSVRH